MERIRVGNNIAISWALYELNGRIHNLEGKDLQLYMACGGYKVYVTDYTIQGNVISWVFLGSEQTKTGDYKLVLVETDPLSGASAFDVKEAFRLTPNDVVGPDVVIGPANVSVRSVLTYSNLVGVESIDVVESTEDDGVNIVTIHLVDGKDATITVKNGSKGDKGDKGDIGATGPKGDKGDTGERGEPGVATASAGVIDPTAVGTPTVDVTLRDKNIDFKFGNLKGEKGDKGDQGNTGSSVEYPYELVNNLTTDDATKGLSAGMGKVLKDEIDEKTVFDISAYHSGSTYATFVLAVADIPSDFQKGGMVIKYKDQTTGKYVQYRLLATSFSDVQSDWALDSEATIEDNPEFVEVHTDSQDKVLYGVKSDGDFHFGSGCPSQVKDAIAKAAATKVDKVDGKSLIDEDVADSVGYQQESPEFVEVKVDANDRVLEGTQTDGTKVIGGDAKIGGSASVKGNARVHGSVELSGATYDLIESPEWAHALLDADCKVVCGIKWDGKFYADIAGVPSEVSDTINRLQEHIDALVTSLDARIQVFEEIFSVVDHPEFISVETDAEGKVLSGRDTDGNKFENLDFKVNGNLSTDKTLNVGGVTEGVIEDPEGRIEILTDSEGKIISYRDADGVKHENVGVESVKVNTDSLNLSAEGLNKLMVALNDAGFSEKYDSYLPVIYVDSKYLTVDGDDIIGLNLTKNEVECTITVKTPTIKFTDTNCNIAYQGNSTLYVPKKGFTLNFGKEYRFGNWLAFDSYHSKAYYYDWMHLKDWLSNTIIEQCYNLRPVAENRPYKKYNNFTNTTIGNILEGGALCHTDEFPVELYINGNYWGLYSFRIKKSRGNYMLTKKDKAHIQVEAANDTYYSNEYFADGGAGWGGIEIRNPNKDSGNDSFSEGVEPNRGEVKLAWQRFINELNSITENTTIQELEEFLNVQEWVDALLNYQFQNNIDIWSKNTIYTCWDSQVNLNTGVITGHWSPCLYDFDGVFPYAPTRNVNDVKAYNYCPWLRTLESILQQKIDARYKELRDGKVFDYNNVLTLINNKTKEIGTDVYKKDIARWNLPSVSEFNTEVLMYNIQTRIEYLDEYYHYNQN